MVELRLYIVQRATAVLMIPFILIHIAVIFYAISDGLTANEILARTGGSLGWGLFYTFFVLLAAAHGAIGVRSVLREWTAMGEAASDIFAIGFCVVLVLLGLRAVVAVVFT
ncbi:MAG: succinate dehydrogenase [Hyphomicrobiaceae bacterium]